MDIMNAMRSRNSYRRAFKQEPVSREDLKEILEAGFLAPSGCNVQTTRFIGVDKPDLVKQLAQIYGKEWALTSTAAILVLTKETLSYGNVSYHIQDFSAATENILLAATAKGYASVWIEGQIKGEKASQMAELLKVPEEYHIAVYLPLGIPEFPVTGPEKMEIQERVWINEFRSVD